MMQQLMQIQDQFLTTKFFIPSSSHRLLSRARLLTLLQRGLLYPLLLVSAPAGFGKTSLLSQWIHSLAGEDVSAIWVSLDTSDNEPLHFWNMLLAALAQKLPDALRSDRIETKDVGTLLTLLINTCVMHQEPIVFVLDDYHTITDSSIQEQITYLIEHLPPHVHVVLSTRTDPAIPLARLRVRQRIMEIRTNALRFTDEEAALFFAEVMHLTLTTTEIMYFVHHVEGWIAGLRLAGYAMREAYTAEKVSVAVHGSQRYILDYVLEEILSSQEEHIQTFLLRTTILSRFSAPLCDALLGQQGSWQILWQLERANLVVEDDQQGWYRYPIVLAEALRSRLERVESEMIPLLHRRASDWYEQHNFPVDAIEHLCEVQDWEHALNLIENMTQQQNSKNGKASSLPSMQNLLVHLPELLVQMHPHLRELNKASEQEEQVMLKKALQESGAHEESRTRQNLPSQHVTEALSTRELEVLQLMAQGASNREIADQLVIALTTVKRHMSNIFGKLQVDNRTQAAACARRLKLLC